MNLTVSTQSLRYRNFISNFLNGGTEVEDKEFATIDKDANTEKVRILTCDDIIRLWNERLNVVCARMNRDGALLHYAIFRNLPKIWCN